MDDNLNHVRSESGPRRILCVIRWPVGGIRTYICYNYPRLIAAGYRFTFVGPDDESFRRFADDVRDWEGVEIVPAPVRKRHGCRLRGVVRSLLRSGRFVLVHSQGVKAAVQVTLANFGLNVPHVITSHDVFRPIHAKSVQGWIQLRLLGWLLSRARVIVTVSEDARDNHLQYLPQLVRHPDRVITINHGVVVTETAVSSETAQADLRTSLGLDSGVFLMGFLGRFIEQKGFLPLLDALERLGQDPPVVPPYHLVAVGDGDYVREYRREVERRHLAAVVSFHESVRHVGPILRQLDLLVMPSLWEAAGMLAMEAMVMGLPVLGSDCIGLREVLAGTPSVIARAGDSLSLARALKAAIESPWTDAARNYACEARARFAVDVSAHQLLGLIHRITGERIAKDGKPNVLEPIDASGQISRPAWSEQQ